ncbi:hypothetical protein KA005_52225, partial [bacterium]|nr:hypothetical protein [bacterium]
WVVPSSGGKAWKLIDGELCPHCLNWDSKNRAIIFYSTVQKRLYRQKLSRRGTKKGRERALDVSGNITSFDYHESTGQIVLTTGMVRHNIWRIPPLTNGTPPTIVSTDFDANYSPMLSSNGEKLFYAAYGGVSSMRLRVYNLTTGSDENLFDTAPSIINEWLPTPDPSDRYVVFQAVSEDTIDLYLYDSLRSDIKRLTRDVEKEFDPIWTSDGMSIYYVWRPLNQDLPHEIRRSTFYFDQSSNQLKQIEGYEPVFTAPRLSYPIPDANGQYLLFQKDSHDESTICVLEPASGYIKSLKHGERPTLSPSRLDIYYHRDQCIYEIKNWPGAFERSEINEQLVFRIPQHLILRFRRPLAVGRDAAYAVLLEQNVGQLRVLKPDH